MDQNKLREAKYLDRQIKGLIKAEKKIKEMTFSFYDDEQKVGFEAPAKEVDIFKRAWIKALSINKEELEKKFKEL